MGSSFLCVPAPGSAAGVPLLHPVGPGNSCRSPLEQWFFHPVLRSCSPMDLHRFAHTIKQVQNPGETCVGSSKSGGNLGYGNIAYHCLCPSYTSPIFHPTIPHSGMPPACPNLPLHHNVGLHAIGLCWPPLPVWPCHRCALWRICDTQHECWARALNVNFPPTK